jgi:hypothetical protein
LQLTHDELAPGAAPEPLLTQHGIFYAHAGSATVNGQELSADNAFYLEDQATIVAGKEGAKIWWWEIVPEASMAKPLQGNGVLRSTLKMARRVKMFELVPTSDWLFRLDCIIGFEGTTGLHSHPGSGIRCMLNGHLRAESRKGESSNNTQPGDGWYEEGANPLVSTVDAGLKATFLRGMILPPEFDRYGDTAYWIEGSDQDRLAKLCSACRDVAMMRIPVAK